MLYTSKEILNVLNKEIQETNSNDVLDKLKKIANVFSEEKTNNKKQNVLSKQNIFKENFGKLFPVNTTCYFNNEVAELQFNLYTDYINGEYIFSDSGNTCSILPLGNLGGRKRTLPISMGR